MTDKYLFASHCIQLNYTWFYNSTYEDEDDDRDIILLYPDKEPNFPQNWRPVS